MSDVKRLQHDERETVRVEAFSDGVFAIAITLLVLQLKVPLSESLTDSSLAKELGQEWPSYFAYVMSFVTILIMWFNHHKLFNHIRRVDGPMMFLNGFLLLMVSVMPWPTALAAEHWGHADERFAIKVYTGISIVMAISFNLLWRYCSHKGRLLAHDYDQHEVDRITSQYNFGPITYTLAFATSFYSATLAMVICMGLAFFFAFTGFLDTRSFFKRAPIRSGR